MNLFDMEKILTATKTQRLKEPPSILLPIILEAKVPFKKYYLDQNENNKLLDLQN
ncbi:MAG: hypothetical protein IIA49_11725 [Bacteroidetes bacterium]|nr:hypothetical protein [Bacteroidota bacterium]